MTVIKLNGELMWSQRLLEELRKLRVNAARSLLFSIGRERYLECDKIRLQA